MAVTREDVAKRANVSTATVSRVINNKENVSDKLKRQVFKAVRELGYKQNFIAKSLSTKKTRQVVIVVDDISNPFYNPIVEGFESEAKKRGYFVNVCVGNDFLDQYFDDFYGRNVDGIYLTSVINENNGIIKAFNQLLQNDTVLVTPYKRDLFIGKTITLKSELIVGMKKIFEHLIDLGHRNIAFINHADNKEERFLNYKKCLQKYNLKYNEDYVVFGEYPYKSTYIEGYNYMKKLFAREIKVTAVIVVNDYMATGVLNYLKDNDYRVPQDISVVSFDNSVFSQIVRPQLTTVDTNNKLQGVEAMKLIDGMLNNKKDVLEKKIPVELIIRESTSMSKG